MYDKQGLNLQFKCVDWSKDQVTFTDEDTGDEITTTMEAKDGSYIIYYRGRTINLDDVEIML
jgi:hypothetical protein